MGINDSYIEGRDMFTLLVAMFAAIFCLVRGVTDLRQRKYVWAAVGMIAGLALVVTTPIPTHAEKIDLGAVPSR